jgi:hypothetical protein
MLDLDHLAFAGTLADAQLQSLIGLLEFAQVYGSLLQHF